MTLACPWPELAPALGRITPWLEQLEARRLQGEAIYPPAGSELRALQLTPLARVSVVILGQDPYHGHGQAHGLAFSVPEGVKPPPSLVNILKERSADLQCPPLPHGDLTAWAQQGVLLLNSVLTVTAGQANSHADQGWETFTDAIIDTVNQQCEGVMFLLWGKPAERKAIRVDRRRHAVLVAPHPSPLSAYRGFFGCRHFSATNAYLQAQGKAPIRW
jgi:uracil-DNA glycosylase